jgi:hypothetical protein
VGDGIAGSVRGPRDPVGGVVTGATAHEGWQPAEVLRALVVQPPVAAVEVPEIDLRSLPRAPADGA